MRCPSSCLTIAFENSFTTSGALVVFDALGLAFDPQVGAAVALLAEGRRLARRWPSGSTHMVAFGRLLQHGLVRLA